VNRPTQRTALRVAAGLFSLLALVGGFLVARRLTNSTWPLQRARLDVVAIAGVAYLASFGFRALGWQRLVPIALLGFMAAQWAREHHGHSEERGS